MTAWAPDLASTELDAQRVLDIAYTPMSHRLRNGLITATYQDLADGLGGVLGAEPNWCTFSQWPSHTVSRLLDVPIPGLGRQVARAFGHGNRFVFADIGQVFVAFLQHARPLPSDHAGVARLVDRCLVSLRGVRRHEFGRPIDGLPRTTAGVLRRASGQGGDAGRALALGIACYGLSLIADDDRTRAQRIWAGNVLMAAHEQAWLDGSLAAGVRMPIRRVLNPTLNLKTVRDARATLLDGLIELRLEEWLVHLVTSTAIGFTFNDQWVRVGRPLTGIARPSLEEVASRADPHDLDGLDPCARIVAAQWPVRRSVDCWLSLDQRVGFIATLFLLDHGSIGHPLSREAVAAVRREAATAVPQVPVRRPTVSARWPDSVLDPLRGEVDPVDGAAGDTAGGRHAERLRKLAEVHFGTPQARAAEVAAFAEDDARRWRTLVSRGLIDDATLQRAATFYEANRLVINAALLFGSLPDGFGAAKGVQVFRTMTKLEREPVRRTGETAHFVIDVMRGDLDDPRSEGRRSILAVRALHARIRRSLEADGEWDPAALGRPLNQEDLLGTVLSFVVPVFETMERCGMASTGADRDAYTATWCAVGRLLGVELEHLQSATPGHLLSAVEAAELAARIRDRQRARSLQGSVMMQALLQDVGDHFPAGFTRLPDALARTIGEPELRSVLMAPDEPPNLLDRLVRGTIAIVGHDRLRGVVPPALEWLGERWFRGFLRQDFRDILTRGDQAPRTPTARLPTGCLDEPGTTGSSVGDALEEHVKRLPVP